MKTFKQHLKETYRITPARRNVLDRLADVASAPFTVERDLPPVEKYAQDDIHQSLYGNPTPKDMRKAEFRKVQSAARLSRIDAIRDMGLPADKRPSMDTDRLLKIKMASTRAIEKRKPIAEVLQPKARVPKEHKDEFWKWNGSTSVYHDPKMELKTMFYGYGAHKGEGAGDVMVMFSVRNTFDGGGEKRDRTKVLARVLDHVNHFVKTYKPKSLVYDTDDQKKERLYKKVGARLGVPVIRSAPFSDQSQV
jgi:hypothetical protein